MEIILSALPVDHPARNSPLAEIKAAYCLTGDKKWVPVTEKWNIAKNTFNQLGVSWTGGCVWRAEIPGEKEEKAC